MAGRALLLAAALLALASCAAENTPEACRVTPIAEIRLDVVRNRPLLDVLVDGKPARFLLDTGASSTIISKTAADRLGLRTDYSGLISSTSVGAQTQTWPTAPVTLTLGGLTLAPANLSVAQFGNQGQVDGFLGGASLAAYDIDIDMPNGRMVLNQARRCGGGPPPFPGPSASYRVPASLRNHIVLPINVDGHDLSALLDTGATRTIVDPGAVGLSEAALSTDRALQAATADPAGTTFHRHRFDSLQVAGELRRNVVLSVGKLRQLSVDALLGSEYWSRHRVWISYAGWTVTIQQPP